MSTFANQLKSEIARIAKKEVRTETSTLKKTSAQYRSEIAALKRRLAALESIVGKLSKHAYFSPSWTAFQADGGRDFSVIVDGISN